MLDDVIKRDNWGRSKQVVALSEESDPFGCKVPIEERIGGVSILWKFCNAEALYVGLSPWNRLPLCENHTIEIFDKCTEEECVYEGNYHRGPWDYEVNTPAGDDENSSCYYHAVNYEPYVPEPR